jgi:proton-translocating NAD(P)+ transhydrogenase subunit alpha
MRVSVPRESAPGESRVALTPEAVGKLTAAGTEVAVERGAGDAAGFPDDEYAAAGASLGTRSEVLAGTAVVACVRRPDDGTVAGLDRGTVLVGFLQPLTDHDGIARLEAQGVIGIAMESVPRITRAQSMDALSSQATVAGYKAVLIAADHVPKLFPMMMTAAGTIAPARVLVLGAGVAGLQAIATARRLGAVVSAFDVRPAVAEQVQSLGAAFLDLGIRGEETEGGYAKELTPEQQAEQQRALEERIPDFDVVVTTALVPGRPAPRLIPATAVEGMRPGSCIVDLAAETGGNCELTVPGETTVAHGVTIVGHTNLPSTMAADASRLYARNVLALLELLTTEGELRLDWEDEIVAGSCVSGRPETPAPTAAAEEGGSDAEPGPGGDATGEEEAT